MEDKEKIFVETEYDNIILIDPNKVVDANGDVHTRAVKQEDLVMYANLEAVFIPRTKMNLGSSQDDTVMPVTIATNNYANVDFLNPGGANEYTTEWSDELTGKDSLDGRGTNQSQMVNDQSSSFHVKQKIKNIKDTQTLGITNIVVDNNAAQTPVITIDLVDVGGRTLFERGDESPYAAFFNLPYPVFYLTLKGYYGKAIRYQIMLAKFLAELNSETGNFIVRLTFYSYKYTILADMDMNLLSALPNMYNTEYTLMSSGNGENEVKTMTVGKGYQKIREVYSEYKSKGLIPPDFPELTLPQLVVLFETYERDILKQLGEEDFSPFTDILTFKNDLKELQSKVYSSKADCWARKYLDLENFFMIKNGLDDSRAYRFKKEISTKQQTMLDALTELETIINEVRTKLLTNSTVGPGGTYEVEGQKKTSEIEYNITLDMIRKSDTMMNINWCLTLRKRFGIEADSGSCKERVLEKYAYADTDILSGPGIVPKNTFFVFSGEDSFNREINIMTTKATTTEEQIENDLTLVLQRKLESATGIGFKPTIRNIFAILFASIEGFFRLMDDVHVAAFEQRYDRYRRNAVMMNEDVTVESKNNLEGVVDLNSTDGRIQIYPWPDVIIKEETEKTTKFTPRYPGDPQLIELTHADDYDVWPEVEFVEEMAKAMTQSNVIFNSLNIIPNEEYVINRLPLNAVEFPVGNVAYMNKDLVNFIYELRERVMLASYGRLNRFNGSGADISIPLAEIEVYNVLNALGSDNPQLIHLLRELMFTDMNMFERYLRRISNSGIGSNWQLYIRGLFNTAYLKEPFDNKRDFALFGPDRVLSAVQPKGDLEHADILVNSLKRTESILDLLDIFPFIDVDWGKNNLADGDGIISISDMYTTTKTIVYNIDTKGITNFRNLNDKVSIRPFTRNFTRNISLVQTMEHATEILSFFGARLDDDELYLTEGRINYTGTMKHAGMEQTTSMFNTPFMLNALSEAAQKLRTGNKTPFIEAAYLFLNSLPLSTLKEKYVDMTDDLVYLDYLMPSFKKFGAVHKLPYAWVLKYGSIWHRYKTLIMTGNDILSDTTIWKDLDTTDGFDPVTHNPGKYYTINLGMDGYSIVHTATTPNVTNMNMGFYPRMMNDMNQILHGMDLFTGYTNVDIQEKIDSGELICNPRNVVIPAGTDPQNPNRAFKVTYWDILLKKDYDPVYGNTSDMGFISILPSYGTNTLQGIAECFPTGPGMMMNDILGNVPVLNGSARLFWAAPNYGYFDTDPIIKPEYNEYFKSIFTGTEKQDTFAFGQNYSSIDEMLPTFKKEILDRFEEEFIKFASFEPGTTPLNDPVKTNFRALFSTIMTVPGNTTAAAVAGVQLDRLQETLKGFLMDNDFFLSYGNPSGFDRIIFNSLSRKTIVDPYVTGTYMPNTLPPDITLQASMLLLPGEWETYYLYMGDQVDVTSLSFFTDMNVAFTSDNIMNLHPLIRIYSTIKKVDPTMDGEKFKDILYEYIISDMDGFESKILEKLLTRLNKDLPIVDSVRKMSDISATNDTVGKLESWNYFKTFNDRWISGNNYRDKTLFEDVLFLDRASRDLGDKVIIDIFKFKSSLKARLSGKKKSRVIDFVSQILQDHKFVMMPLPAFVNFYGATTPGREPTEPMNGFQDDLFGTFLNVDYRKSTPKLVCFYTDLPSQHLDLKDNPNYLYRTDAFDIGMPRNNPLREDQSEKTDWFLSNKCVGFNVDFNTTKQAMFKSFILNQNNTANTIEVFKVQEQMGAQAGGTTVMQQNQSLFTEYRNRSYSCTIMGMGNALIQPTMYFNLQHVPMFNGPYLIMSVKHIINSGDFITEFTGVRMPIFSLPSFNNPLMSLNVKMFSRIFGDMKGTIRKMQESGELGMNPKEDGATVVLETMMDRKFITEGCLLSDMGDPSHPYNRFLSSDQIIMAQESIQGIVDMINDIVTGSGEKDNKIKAMIFSAIYIDGYSEGTFRAWNYNFGGASFEDPTGEKYRYPNNLLVHMEKEYICLNGINGKTRPYPVFSGTRNNIMFLKDIFSSLSANINLPMDMEGASDNTDLITSLFRNWVMNFPYRRDIDMASFTANNDKLVALLKRKISESMRLANKYKLFG